MYERLHELRVEQLEFMPAVKQSGVLYVSKRFELAIHLCACGCGMETVTPLRPSGGWTMTGTDALVTLRPSILNRAAVCPSSAHYYVTENKIDWM